MLIKKISFLALAVAALSASSAFAGVVPAFTSFGTLADATFGGSGIPNHAVAYTVANGITIGLTAHQRFTQPALTNNGAGVFQAQTGAFAAGDNIARWNFAYYIDIGTRSANDFVFSLFVDLLPAAGNDISTYRDASLLTMLARQDSQNLGFGTTTIDFDPTKAGQYGFVLEARGRDGGFVGDVFARSAILVNVGQVPEPASLALVGVALLGVAGAARRKRV